jgi:hypothetical protein
MSVKGEARAKRLDSKRANSQPRSNRKALMVGMYARLTRSLKEARLSKITQKESNG